MTQSINIQQLFAKAFGIPMPEYKLQELDKPKPLSNSLYGTPYYGSNPLTGQYHFLPVFLDIEGDSDYELPFPVVRIQSQKIIVETPMTERKGSVVELVSQESWKVNIKGFIVSSNGQYPEEAIQRMVNVYERNVPVRMRCALTDLCLAADDRVVIKSLNFPEVRGVEHVKPYEMDLVSVSIFDLIDLTPIG